ncbi:MAG: GNAT family N-acetyltransferase [Bacteroidetes bacterium]|nr:GNAT family N-acetyltransferase [Bacteroidota bacterium]
MNLRLANPEDKNTIWEILLAAIEQRRKDGSDQWQNGYPNEQTVITDIQNGHGYVLVDNQAIIAYAAIIFGIEPTYTDIQGQWLSNGDYAVVHRVATAEALKRKGMGANLFLLIEGLCVEKNVFSIKVDTNFDNVPMLRILDKLNYTYCGEIFFSGASRKAYEKLLIQTT